MLLCLRKNLTIDMVWCRYLSPLSAVPLVTLTGLGFFVLGFPLVIMLNLSLCYGLVDLNSLSYKQRELDKQTFFFQV